MSYEFEKSRILGVCAINAQTENLSSQFGGQGRVALMKGAAHPITTTCTARARPPQQRLQLFMRNLTSAVFCDSLPLASICDGPIHRAGHVQQPTCSIEAQRHPPLWVVILSPVMRLLPPVADPDKLRLAVLV